jgi:hypothetical protein
MKGHAAKIIGEHAGRLRVVRHIEHDGRPARQDLEAAGQFHRRQPLADVLLADRQTVTQRLERRQYAVMR